MDVYVLSFQVKSFKNYITESIGVFRGDLSVLPPPPPDKKILDFMRFFFFFLNPGKIMD